MEFFINAILQNAIGASILAIFAILLQRAAKQTLHPVIRYMIWGIVALRFLCLFQLPALQVPQLLSWNSAAIVNGEELLGNISANAPLLPLFFDLHVSATSIINPLDEGHVISFVKILLTLWIAGVFLSFLWIMTRNIRFNRSIHKEPVVFNAEQEALYSEILQTTGCKKALPVYLSANAASPFLGGLYHPYIVLTSAVLHDMHLLKYTLLHELFHARQKDNFFRLLGCIICIFYWFCPFSWLALAAASHDAELLCDYRVNKYLSHNETVSYCQALLLIATAKNTSLTLQIVPISRNGKAIKNRIAYMIGNRPKRSVSVVSIFLTVCLCIGSLAFASPAKAQVKDYKKSEFVSSSDKLSREIHWDILWPLRNTSIEQIKNIMTLIDAVPSPNPLYVRHTTNVCSSKDYDQGISVNYELHPNWEHLESATEDEMRRIADENAFLLFAMIPDLEYIHFYFLEKIVNSTTGIVSAARYEYTRAVFTERYADSVLLYHDVKQYQDILSQGIALVPSIQTETEQNFGGNNIVSVTGYSEILSDMGITKEQYKTLNPSELFEIVGLPDDSWYGYKGESSIYLYKKKSPYGEWGAINFWFSNDGKKFYGYNVMFDGLSFE